MRQRQLSVKEIEGEREKQPRKRKSHDHEILIVITTNMDYTSANGREQRKTPLQNELELFFESIENK